jgi:hypothetical protein
MSEHLAAAAGGPPRHRGTPEEDIPGCDAGPLARLRFVARELATAHRERRARPGKSPTERPIEGPTGRTTR